MAGTYTSDYMAPQPLGGGNAYYDTGSFTDDGTTANVEQSFSFTPDFAECKQDDAADKVLKCTLSGQKVTFESPANGKKYRCHVIGRMR